MLKIRRFYDRLIFNMGIPYLQKTLFTLRRSLGHNFAKMPSHMQSRDPIISVVFHWYHFSPHPIKYLQYFLLNGFDIGMSQNCLFLHWIVFHFNATCMYVVCLTNRKRCIHFDMVTCVQVFFWGFTLFAHIWNVWVKVIFVGIIHAAWHLIVFSSFLSVLWLEICLDWQVRNEKFYLRNLW